MGRFDGFYEYGLKPWDVCAGELILKEAGGIATDWDGERHVPENCNRILATNGHIHNDMATILQKDKYQIFITIKH